MTQLDVVFAVMVFLTFCLSVANYMMFDCEKRHHVPMSEFHRYTFICMLSGFCVTEGIVATGLVGAWAAKTYVLYVLLNVYGIKSLWRRGNNAIY